MTASPPLRGYKPARVPGVKSLEGFQCMKGLAAYIERDGDVTRITFDDIETDAAGGPTTWGKTVLYTSNVYPSSDLEDLSLSKDHLRKSARIFFSGYWPSMAGRSSQLLTIRSCRTISSPLRGYKIAAKLYVIQGMGHEIYTIWLSKW